MNVYLLRNIYTPVSTIGDLIIKNNLFCHTLEDVVRPPSMPKIFGKTAIPAGRYKLAVSMSNRFKRMMPLIEGVPNFDGIRMHGGNTAEDTEGCVLVAKNIINATTIHGTMEKDLTELLQSNKGYHWIEILDTYPYNGIQ
jgi:hypothetical protein